MKYASTWLLFAIFIGVGTGSVNLPLYRTMSARGVRAQGNVIGFPPNTHQSVRYEYRVGEQTLQGQSHSHAPNPPYDRLSVGQPLIVYYDPQDPAASVLGEPEAMFRSETASVVLGAIILPSFAVAMWAFTSRRKRSATSAL